MKIGLKIFMKYGLVFVFAALFFGFPESYLNHSPLASAYYKAEAVLLVFLVLFLVYYLVQKRVTCSSLSTLEIFSILLLAIPFYSALMAFITFSQPLYLGILAERRWGMSLLGLLIFYLLSIKYIDVEWVARMFLIVSIFLIVFGVLIEHRVLNPMTPYYFRRFSNVAVVYVVIYCMLLFKNRRNWFLMCLIPFKSMLLKVGLITN